MNESVSELLKHAIQHMDLGEYKKAQAYLDSIIKEEPENYLAWYEKSKLPILQEDDVTVKNRTLSISVYQQHSLAEKSNYLQQCGFEIAEIAEVEDLLKIPHLVASQRKKYLKMAIRYAPEQEKRIYKTELHTLILSDEKRRQADKRASIILGLIALPLTIVVAFSIILFPNAILFESPMLLIITLLIPYSLSVVGMTFSTKAKRNEASTILGFVCNLTALIISNLSVINVIITLIIK